MATRPAPGSHCLATRRQEFMVSGRISEVGGSTGTDLTCFRLSGEWRVESGGSDVRGVASTRVNTGNLVSKRLK